jgi:DNA polymerase III delta prime subunit
MEKHYSDGPDDKGDDDDDDDFMPSVKKKKATTTSKKRSKKDLNMVLFVGPHGVGKTASVFTAAQETGYQVFELHPGIKRSLKEVLRLVGDMTKNHLVRFNNQEDRGLEDSSDVDMDSDSQPNQLVTQFFAPKSTTPKSTTQQKPAMQRSGPKQSLILLEEVDLVYQSDKGFWNAVTDLAQSSKRPIILTCNGKKQTYAFMLSL